MANVKVHVHALQALTERLSHLSSYGFLLGMRYRYDKDFCVVLGCTHCKTEDVMREASAVTPYLAAGISIVGLYVQSSKGERDEDVLDRVHNYSPHNLFSDGEFLVLPLHGNTRPDHVFLHSNEEGYTSVDLETTDTDILTCHTVVRTKCNFQVHIKMEDSSDSWRSNLSSQVEDICNRVNSDCAVLHIDNSSILIASNRVCGLGDDSAVSDIYENINVDSDFVQTRRKKSKLLQTTLRSTLFFQTTGDISLRNLPDCAPVIQHKFEKYKSVQMDLPVDVVTVVAPLSSVQELLPLVKSAVCNQVHMMARCITRSAQKKSLHLPQPYHFMPCSTFPCTVVYPKGIEDEKLEGWRRELHTLFCQSLDVPVFRRANKLLFHDDKENHPYLINPHIGLSTSTVKGGKQYLVQGLYSYHHYMQDRFDDDKWGCAYRSLQTLVSWFRFQGYTQKPIPTHREIQQALVDVGDKEAKFVGSRQWIGSMEVSYCLDHLIGVTSRIMFVNAGSEMGTKGRELAVHFQTQGTPIMIGGGVLAHTILGVDFNEVTGDVKFLILDPHYTGGEDLNVIQDKGWCGWKGTDFWDKTAHYNLCMPQRPKVI